MSEFKVGDRVIIPTCSYYNRWAHNKEAVVDVISDNGEMRMALKDSEGDISCQYYTPGKYSILPNFIPKEQSEGLIEELSKQKIVGSKLGDRYNSDKPRVELLVPEAMEETAKVWAFGANKYSDHNWKKGLKVLGILGCILRHTFKIMKGEDIDEESKCMHAAHIICNASMLIYFFKRDRYKELDDRYKGE